MTTKEASELRRQWKLQGNPACNHAHKEKELVMGSDTGDRICIQCGKAFYPGMPDEDSDDTLGS